MSRAEQEAVYSAQSALWGYGRRFYSIQDVTHYVAGVLDAPWFIEIYGYHPPVTVFRAAPTRWGGAANKRDNEIVIKTMEEAVVLHELAHLITPDTGHGAQFVKALLFLIRNCMGFYAWADFYYALKQTKEFQFV